MTSPPPPGLWTGVSGSRKSVHRDRAFGSLALHSAVPHIVIVARPRMLRGQAFKRGRAEPTAHPPHPQPNEHA